MTRLSARMSTTHPDSRVPSASMMGLAAWLDVLQQIVMCGLQCAHHTDANGGNFEPNPTTRARLGSPSPHEDENAMADARSETTIDDERVRVTTWSFEKAGDSTGAHVHEYDDVLVPVTGGTLTAVSTTDGSARTITQVAGSPYTGQAGLAHTVTADADGIVFVEVELKK
jgi:beta-alanine degradation protein BauB